MDFIEFGQESNWFFKRCQTPASLVYTRDRFAARTYVWLVETAFETEDARWGNALCGDVVSAARVADSMNEMYRRTGSEGSRISVKTVARHLDVLSLRGLIVKTRASRGFYIKVRIFLTREEAEGA